MYSIYHGPIGLKNISKEVIEKTKYFRDNVEDLGLTVENTNFFDTLTITTDLNIDFLNQLLEENKYILRKTGEKIIISIDETTQYEDLDNILKIIANFTGEKYFNPKKCDKSLEFSEDLRRKSKFLEQEIFNKYHTETQLVRYIHQLQNKDYTLCDGMIPLGSCTMKLNSVFELEPLSWDDITKCHPYLPLRYVRGYQTLIKELGENLKEITGFCAVSFQSNSGAMGEYSGLITIKKYLESRGEGHRNICLIPNTAHGTNFSSAKLSNYQIIVYDDNISLKEFRELVEKNKDNLGALMVTYPNTNGTFQKDIKEICEIIHKNGGLVYMDGANMNAQVGITSPGNAGADVCHLNLHKTFCIPHGGGGPGMGPILCNEKLKDFLPNNIVQNPKKNEEDNWSITSSEWSSASLLTIPYLYISAMGNEGLKKATQIAILNDNYLKDSLKDYYNIKDVNENGRVAHEFIIDTTEFKDIGITDVDISKRLIDYSFHSPTMSWPRQNVLMFEPTESESKEELDRLIESLISIKKEISYVQNNIYSKDNNLLKNSPHTINMLFNWNKPYNQKEANYPLDNLKNKKFWASVSRVDDVLGDRNILKKN